MFNQFCSMNNAHCGGYKSLTHCFNYYKSKHKSVEAFLNSFPTIAFNMRGSKEKDAVFLFEPRNYFSNINLDESPKKTAKNKENDGKIPLLY